MFTCWCGGPVGGRSPGDEAGLGCLSRVEHDWQGEPPGLVEAIGAARAAWRAFYADVRGDQELALAVGLRAAYPIISRWARTQDCEGASDA